MLLSSIETDPNFVQVQLMILSVDGLIRCHFHKPQDNRNLLPSPENSWCKDRHLRELVDRVVHRLQPCDEHGE